MTLFYERCNMLHVIALAVLPAIILIYYTNLQDKLQRKPVGNIVRVWFPIPSIHGKIDYLCKL